MPDDETIQEDTFEGSSNPSLARTQTWYNRISQSNSSSLNNQHQFTSKLSSVGTFKKVDDASDKDPVGLKVIHRPSGDRRVDIVFVHGLGGSSRMTWSKYHNLEYFWPLKFLPFEPGINEARISTFGYNANFRSGTSKNTTSVLDFAKDLLYDLKYANDELEPEQALGMGEVGSLLFAS